MTSNQTSISASASEFLHLILDWSHGGIDFSVLGNGGLECRDHVSLQRRIEETFIGIGVASGLYVLHKWWQPQPERSRIKSFQRLTNASSSSSSSRSATFGSLRLYLLASLSFVFGMEVAYKFATKQLIFLLAPCHVTSIVQMYLLTSEVNPWSNYVYQIMLHYM